MPDESKKWNNLVATGGRGVVPRVAQAPVIAKPASSSIVRDVVRRA